MTTNNEKQDRKDRYQRRRGHQITGEYDDQPQRRRPPYKRSKANYDEWDEESWMSDEEE